MKNCFHLLHRLAFVVLCMLLGRLSAVSAQSSADPSLEERLKHICSEIEQQRIASHVPGCSLTIVKDGNVVLTRGFGVRDVEKNLPADENTIFAIGSTTKAMTATLIGMLVDEGKMSWDDHPRKYLPEFRISDPTADEQVTIRDLLCHRIGFGSNDLLWYGGAATREEILAAVSNAKLLNPFRSKFVYNNVMYLAAGQAAGRAANSNWDTLIAERIFKPLGMRSSNTSITIAQQSPHLAKGYHWDTEKSAFVHDPMRNLDNIAPAGAVNSNAQDMAQWVALLLAKGNWNGVQLVSEESLDETWSPHIPAGDGMHYGLGWGLREWNGKRMLAHSGGIDGFGAFVALLPDHNVGFVLLTNVMRSSLLTSSAETVFNGLLGDLKPKTNAIDVTSVQDYLGKYRFEAMGVDVTAIIQNGTLAVDVPGQTVYELKPPDAEGKWIFAAVDQIAVSFERNESGKVTAMKIHQSGLVFELPREGVEQPIELTANDAQQYLGVYHSNELDADLRVLHRNGRLAIDVPKQMVYDLHLPDESGKWAFRAKKSIQIAFERNDRGEVESLTMFQNGMELKMPRTETAGASDLPTVDEIVALHAKGHGSANIEKIKTLKQSGSLDFIHQGANGDFVVYADGLDRFSHTFNIGRFGSISVIRLADRSITASTFDVTRELTGDDHLQTRLQHPLAIASDWRTFYDDIQVDRADIHEGRKVFVVTLTVGQDRKSTAFVDAETGRVVKEVLSLRDAEGAGTKSTFTYDDYQPVEGVYLPMRFTMQNDAMGDMIAVVRDVQTNRALPDDAFSPPPHPGVQGH